MSAVPCDDTQWRNTELYMSFQTMVSFGVSIARHGFFHVLEREREVLPLNDKCRTSSTHRDLVCPCKARTTFLPLEYKQERVHNSSEILCSHGRKLQVTSVCIIVLCVQSTVLWPWPLLRRRLCLFHVLLRALSCLRIVSSSAEQVLASFVWGAMD